LQIVLDKVNELDKSLAESQPWKKQGDEQTVILQDAVKKIVTIAHYLRPFMPNTSKKILEHFSRSQITALTPLFPRLNEK
jgi:methionyl-tRNA synthetase